MTTTSLSFFDIAINATDSQFRGIYRGTRKHKDDFTAMHQRAQDSGCRHWLITGGDLADSKAALELARSDSSNHWYSTAGVHPTRSNIMNAHPAGPAAYFAELKEVIRNGTATGHVRAIGECGLDYDRLDWSSKSDQLPVFAAHLELAKTMALPLFLHSRACEEDFLAMLLPHTPDLPRRGVVHSFTGTCREMQQLTQLGWSIGINGCSLKTPENLDVVRQVPLDLMMLETDAPWCEIRPSHAGYKYCLEADAPSQQASKKVERFEYGSMVKGRNEPCSIRQVAWIVSKAKGIPYEEVVNVTFQNAMKMFG